MDPQHTDLEEQIGQWRGYVQRRAAIATADVDELEDHLRGQIADLTAGGLDEEEAFLVAIKRMGNLDSVSREFAREHSDRLWKQLVVIPDGTPDSGDTTPWRELAVVLGIAAGAGLAIKLGFSLISDEEALARNIGLLVFPFIAGYFAWKRKLTWQVLATLAIPFLVLAVVVNVYPFISGGSTELIAALHTPVALWLLAGVAYVGGKWRSDPRRMDFVRFTGELAIYFALIAMGGGIIIGLTGGVFSMLDVPFEPILQNWIIPFCVPGAFIVAMWLVEAKQSVVENIAPVLTKVFTPITVLALTGMLGAIVYAGGVGNVDRDLLIIMDAILVLVVCLLLYSISARDSFAPPGFFDILQLVLVVAALAVDAVMLTAMLTRIAEFGFSPNKTVALGLNLLLLVHLAWTGWLVAGFVRRTRTFTVVEKWQTTYVPLYGIWAALVVVAIPPIFGFK